MPSTKPHAPSLKPEHQFAQTIINSKLCTDMNYTLYSNQTQEQLYLTVEETSQDEAMAYYNKKKDLQGDIVQYHSNERVNAELLFTPVFITVTLQSCPPGFTLLGDPPGCDSYPVLTGKEVKCDFINGTGYISWNGPMWVNMDTNFTDQIFVAQYCSSEHCQTGEKMVSLQDDPDAQCVFNHAGRLWWLQGELQSASRIFPLHLLSQQQLPGTPYLVCSCRSPAGVLHCRLQPHRH